MRCEPQRPQRQSLTIKWTICAMWAKRALGRMVNRWAPLVAVNDCHQYSAVVVRGAFWLSQHAIRMGKYDSLSPASCKWCILLLVGDDGRSTGECSLHKVPKE
jgi:hypothetical protein